MSLFLDNVWYPTSKKKLVHIKKFNFKRLHWGQIEVHLFQIMLLPGGQVDVIHSLSTPARTLFISGLKS